ncbi:MAG: GNAT family N-acetyltransferase [Chitinophagaceae bacterium]|nr:GNAT family N-acetyltransferase [Chitinophagaceae bacterium]HQZ78902.1 GNAT family N-acetyltransferase [Bacteroidia bacterium]
MLTTKRTASSDTDFQTLVKALDTDLKIRDGEEHDFYHQFNKINLIKYAVVAYDGDEAVGCGAVKEYSSDSMEVKRMYVPPQHRGKGIASIVLKELESWCKEQGYKKCILETGKKQPEAIELYKKNGYKIIANYGQYSTVANSVCFEKSLII